MSENILINNKNNNYVRTDSPRPISNGVKLIFVYNSDGTVASFIKDTTHKLVSPETYPCNLCRLTYPLASMKGEWRKFIESLPHEVIFLHRDEFRKQYPDQKNVQLPAVFRVDPSAIQILISHNEINKAKNLSELIEIVNRFLLKLN